MAESEGLPPRWEKQWSFFVVFFHVPKGPNKGAGCFLEVIKYLKTSKQQVFFLKPLVFLMFFVVFVEVVCFLEVVVVSFLFRKVIVFRKFGNCCFFMGFGRF